VETKEDIGILEDTILIEKFPMYHLGQGVEILDC
jgi:hypothetical protein